MRANAIDSLSYAKATGVFTVSDEIQQVEGKIQAVNIHETSSDQEDIWRVEYDNRKKNWKSNNFIEATSNNPSSSNPPCEMQSVNEVMSINSFTSIEHSSETYLLSLHPLSYR